MIGLFGYLKTRFTARGYLKFCDVMMGNGGLRAWKEAV
jgi:hypothetical protein